MAGAAMLLPLSAYAHEMAAAIPATPAIDASILAPFVDPLPIPVVLPHRELRPSPANSRLMIPYYRIAMRECAQKLHRDLKPTRMWGYGASVPGPLIETASGKPLLVEWANDLPAKHFLPIDYRLHGAKGQPDVRAVVHVHGAKAPPESDGYPEDWYVPGKSKTYYYPNDQHAAMLWYHDHAMGINRLNIYAGMFGLYIIRDESEAALNLPSGKYEVPLVICDRMLDAGGQLIYPVSGKPNAPWIPEFFGNLTLVNGKIMPFLEVEPRKYRFRVLNASNARHFILSLSNQAHFHQVGSDQGLLSAPVDLANLFIAPAERADLVVDFKDHRGDRIVLNDSALPIMQFRVSTNASPDSSAMPAKLSSIRRTPESEAIKTRILTLNEYDNEVAEPILMLLNATYWHQPVTENPVLDSTEIWNLINLTDDAHPIHLHLVRFQILDRRKFDKFAYTIRKTLRYTGPVVPPDPSEMGWKDTVRADPAMVTRIIAKFEGYPGRYVWHCHNLDHEDNEMMRPYEVVTAASLRNADVAPPSAPMCIGGRIAER
ncbi:MAG: multicopper oxidase [Candidatus Binatus sp.]